MGWFIISIFVAIVGLFVWSHFSVKAEEKRLLKEDPGALYPFFGVFTNRCIYTTGSYQKDVILSNTDTGKIYIGGQIYNMLEITNCDSKTSGGKFSTSYEDVNKIKTNTGSALGRAIVGGVVAGGVGAIVGASTATREIRTERVAKNT